MSGQRPDREQRELTRRGFLHVGGLVVAGTAVLGACGNGEDGGGATTTTTTALSPAARADVDTLRSATSMELAAVGLYQSLIDAGVATGSLLEAVQLFQSHHSEHASALRGKTRAVGGEAATEADSAVLARLQPRVDALATEADAASVIYDLELLAASTYIRSAGSFATAELNRTAMSIGGVEARHLSVVAPAAGQPPVSPGGFLRP